MPSPTPLRILHLTAGSDAGGVSRYLLELSRRLGERGHAITIAGERGEWHAPFEQAHWPWLDLPLKGGPFALHRASRQLLRWLRDHPTDIVHCHYRKSAMVGGWAARRARVPMLFTLHLTGIPMGPAWRWLTNFGDHCHAPSELARDWLIEAAKVKYDDITVIPHGIDESQFPFADRATQTEARAALGLPVGPPIAAYVGRFDVPKNEDWIIDLAVQSRAVLPELILLMIGEGPHAGALRQRINRLGLTDTVRLMPYGDPMPVYRAIDALLLPSAQEGFSYVCAEAMSVGRAVLRTCTAGCHEQIIEGITGRMVEVNRDAFIQTALEMLADQPSLRAMGQVAAAHVRERLTITRQVEQTEQLYRTLVALASHP